MTTWFFIYQKNWGIKIFRKMNFSFDNSLILENTRVKLEPLQKSHFESLLPFALKYPDLLRYSPSPFGTPERLQVYIDAALKAKAQKVRFPFAIFDKKTGQYAGTTSYGNISNPNQRLEIGWTWIGKEFQRTGLNRNCKFLLLRYGFEMLEFERIELKTDARNMQSRTAIKGIGAQYEGKLRSHVLMPDGYRRDTVYYSILKKEWPAIKTTIFQNGFL